MSNWTDERFELLKAMRAAGNSYSEISASTGMSIGSCAGKLFRLGMTTKRVHTSVDHLSELHFAKKSRRNREAPSFAGRVRREIKAQELRAQLEAVEIVDLPPDQSAVAVPFSKLTNHTCRWPIGDARDLDAMRFCGAEPNESRPYCERHVKIAYVPLPRRGAA